MRLSNPYTEQQVVRHIKCWLEPKTRRQAILQTTGRVSLGPLTTQRLDFYLATYSRNMRRRHTRTRAGLAMGYDMYRILPVKDLRSLNKPVRGQPWLRYFELMPRGMLAADLAALNFYLEEIVHTDPCPFELLVRRGVWQDGSWRDLAKQSVLWGSF